jgi:hypothetical protein
MIGASIDPAKLKRFDAAAIVREAQARAPRRRVVTGSLGIVAAAAGAAALVVVPGDRQPTEAQPPPVGPRGRPACSPPRITVLDTAIGQGATLKTIAVGQTATVEAELQPARHLRVTRAVLVVGRPGSTAGGGDPTSLPANAALRPENQVTTSAPLIDVMPNGQRLGVSLHASAPGRYPVFAIRWYVASDNCEPPAPPTGTPVESSTIAMVQLGEIEVQ